MTSVVGIYCKDGCVIGTDSSITMSANSAVRTVEQLGEKISIVDNSVVIAGTGSFGLGQRFGCIIQKLWQEKSFQNPNEVSKQISRLMHEDMRSTYLNPGQYGAFIAFPCQKGHYLCEYDPETFQPEFKNEKFWYGSMGSAQLITDPFLGFMRDVFWRDGLPTVTEAVFTVTWTLEHAITVNTGGVNGPIRIAVLEKTKGVMTARVISDEELDEHRQSIADIKDSMKNVREKFKGENVSVPNIPKRS